MKGANYGMKCVNDKMKGSNDKMKDTNHVMKGVSSEMNEVSGLKGMGQFIREEDGMGTVEIILIVVVLVGLVLIFKEQITDIIDSLFKKITSQTNKV